MIFLLEYNQPTGALVSFREFDTAQRLEAQDSRLNIELDLNRRGIVHEVVLLEAENKAAIMKTHGRYFKSLQQMLEQDWLAETPPAVSHAPS